MRQMEIFEPEHDPEVERKIRASIEEYREEQIKHLAKMRNVFIPIKCAAHICLWDCEAALNDHAARHHGL